MSRVTGFASAEEFLRLEPESDFCRCGFQRVGAMHEIGLQFRRIVAANRAGERFGGLRRADHAAAQFDRISAFPDGRDDRTGGHKIDEFSGRGSSA